MDAGYLGKMKPVTWKGCSCLLLALVIGLGCGRPTHHASEVPQQQQVATDLIKVRLGAPGDSPTSEQIDRAVHAAHKLLRLKGLLANTTLVDTTDRHQVFPRVTDEYALRFVHVTGIAKQKGHPNAPWKCIMILRDSNINWLSIDVKGQKPYSELREWKDAWGNPTVW